MAKNPNYDNEDDISALKLSRSVTAAISDIFPRDMVYSTAIIERILKYHPEYGRSKGGKLNLKDIRKEKRKTLLEWMNGVRSIYNENVQLLDGRLVILGLGMIDRPLGLELHRINFIDEIQSELELKDRKPFVSLLTELGQEYWNKLGDFTSSKNSGITPSSNDKEDYVISVTHLFSEVNQILYEHYEYVSRIFDKFMRESKMASMDEFESVHKLLSPLTHKPTVVDS